ncbi:fungal-specific transcription factor domain-containing protein [Fimicolochytrium jonesii]|uniref:fungal-specific transcription factor domain-containing protein n=1 Tax=Fimicolochytrium jonesii TaxID=1396493 RepID=UPI0022FEAD3D|nr:fungal-specific transcription factor domain-containing protein [Fimicolochytrium jonesii]KAI8818473.1 fungal-specific transcription factor domain-containing protein [Fimicolochytrium jonesii]
MYAQNPHFGTDNYANPINNPQSFDPYPYLPTSSAAQDDLTFDLNSVLGLTASPFPQSFQQLLTEDTPFGVGTSGEEQLMYAAEVGSIISSGGSRSGSTDLSEGFSMGPSPFDLVGSGNSNGNAVGGFEQGSMSPGSSEGQGQLITEKGVSEEPAELSPGQNYSQFPATPSSLNESQNDSSISVGGSLDFNGSVSDGSSSKRASTSSNPVSTRLIAKPNTRRKACEPCRAKKLRCDGIRPRCSTCTKSTQGVTCVYYADKPADLSTSKSGAGPDDPTTDSTQKKPKRRTADVKALEDRVVALEALLAAANANNTGSTSEPSYDEHGKPPLPGNTPFFSPEIHQTSDAPSSSPAGKAQSALLNEDLKKSWFKDFVSVFKDKLTLQTCEQQCPKSFPQEPVPQSEMLPNLNEILIRRDLLDVHFSRSSCFLPYPIVHRRSFLSTIADESPMLLFALYADACSHSPDPKTRNSATFFYQRARKLVPVHLENPSVSGLQALYFLATASMALGLMSTAWMFNGMACRMAQFLRLDLDPEELGIEGWLEVETRRRLWWGVWTMDLVKGSVQGKATFFERAKTHNVKLPCSDGLWENCDAEGNLPAHLMGMDNHNYLSAVTSFCPTYAKAIRYNREALATPTLTLSEIDPTAVLLEAQVEHWYAQCSPLVHSVPTAKQFTRDSLSESATPYHAVNVHLTYIATLCLLRRPRIIAALTADVKTPQAMKAIENAKKASDAVADMAAKLLEKVSPDAPTRHAHNVSYITSLGVLEAGFIQIMLSAYAAAMSDETELENSQRRFACVVRLLKAFGRRFPPPRAMAQVIALINERVLRGSRGKSGGEGGDAGAVGTAGMLGGGKGSPEIVELGQKRKDNEMLRCIIRDAFQERR